MRTRGLLVLTVCLGAVTACSQTAVTEAPPPIDAHTDTTHPTHDRSAGLLDAQFDPCTDLTEEQLSAAGLVGRIDRDSGDPSIYHCGWIHQDRGANPGVFLVGTDQSDKKKLEQQQLEVSDWAMAATDDVYVHRMGVGIDESCAAALDLEWGRFMVTYSDLGSEEEYLTVCPRSVEMLDLLMIQIGGS